MPTYDYECRSCGHNFEAFQRMSDNALTDCPQCYSNQLRRLIGGGTGIIFKGSGFYVNDTRKSESKTSQKQKKSSDTNKSPDSGRSSDSSKSPSSSQSSGKTNNSASP